MIDDVELNVLLGQEVVNIDRTGCQSPPSEVAPIQITSQDTDGEKLIFGSAHSLSLCLSRLSLSLCLSTSLDLSGVICSF
jgi:hypothetical protein